MYNQHFGFVELPFSIVPNSRFLYLSQRHKEAIYHLQSGLGDGGGFAMLSGEVGTGKTTVAKAMLNGLDGSTQAGFILNPTFSNIELLEAICDEFGLDYQPNASLKQLNSLIKQFLLDSYANGKQTLLLIDEAQHLSVDVLEQLRLLTNLETDQHKLLKVLLIGQPELQQKLQMPQLRQLAQRITGRYHLLPLDAQETAKYIQFRVQLVGGNDELFSSRAVKYIAEQTQGIPRLINLVCDASLKRAYQLGEEKPSYQSVEFACDEVMSFQASFQQPQLQRQQRQSRNSTLLSAGAGLLLAAGVWWSVPNYLQQPIHNWVVAQNPAKPNIETTKQIFPPQLGELVLTSQQFESSLADLYALWGYQASRVDKLCIENNQSLFHCQSFHGDLAELKQHNLPAVVTLEHEGQTRYAVLDRLDDTQVELVLQGKRVIVATEWFEQMWQGDYHLIWQRGWYRPLAPGMSGSEVASLDSSLSHVLELAPSSSSRYGAEVKEKVELFQRWQGLSVDGIAGAETLQRLELYSQGDAPKLQLEERS
ncbi:ExeA family protein [Vibrio intestinalis]|uniref:ExeA family protein n=1 Tax=Vibrio intestinalis TaxID=2933291 RepID=UPI0021A8CEF4|nr:ExeA family protein [Vibrio intestinalis]